MIDSCILMEYRYPALVRLNIHWMIYCSDLFDNHEVKENETIS